MLVTSRGEKIENYKILYNGSSNGEITLNDSCNNYDFIMIFYSNNSGSDNGSVTLYKPNNKTFNLQIINVSGSENKITYRTVRKTIKDNKITTDLAGYAENSNVSDGNYIYITMVIGHS